MNEYSNHQDLVTDQGVATEESVMIMISALDPVNEYKTEI